jgi:hypothetical protein
MISAMAGSAASFWKSAFSGGDDAERPVCLDGQQAVAGGPHLNFSTKSGGPYLDLEMWTFAKMREPPSFLKR